MSHELAEYVIYSVIASWTSVFLFAHYRIWNAPARALERRPAAGQERSRAEMREIMDAEGNYLTFFALFAFFLLMLFNLASQSEPLGYVDMAFMALYIVMIPTTGLLIVRKWRFNRRNRAS